MMKVKTGIFSLAFLILCIGIQIDFHFAGSEFYSYALFGEAESCCDGPCDCCHNESIYLVIDSEYSIPGSTNVQVNLEAQDFSFMSLIKFPVKPVIHTKDQYLFPDSPPLDRSNNIPVLFQAFRC